MQKGIVKWFDGTKGFGFISAESGEDLFVHYSALNMVGYKCLDVGQPVSFEITQGKKGPQAIHVDKIPF